MVRRPSSQRPDPLRYLPTEEELKGSLKSGKLADLVVLSHDILTVPADEILDASVDMTVVGGEVVYER